MFGVDTLPIPNNPREASQMLDFVRATRDICDQEKCLVELKLYRLRLGYKIYRREMKRVGNRLLIANGEVGKARSLIRQKGLPVTSPIKRRFKHSQLQSSPKLRV